MSSYKLTANAKEDLYRIYEYGVATFGEQQAETYFAHLTAVFANIADTPLLYPSVDHIRPGYRRCVCGSDSIYYRIRSEHIEIVAIIRGQDVGVWL
ncbi:type II toxin-antitoxin system RelE/ParE family toxin [Idiomarina abyssalis]|uniref:Type II toxin-antitoxin system RelE/ParE family toxin n=1 Tax=Idiomarina abyssalis TaxID=86102 RepID=A0A8I1GAZ2_9GAMM|nr:type II toxin-antitoxin system RelE/ParE family toxin [Idiomarina abyssalis]MBJ7267308.1 type II toxin-antitoxin system RelE/ParE family toxin [Idiomarina abyssalis]MBJ7273634.1 type II toxin-antitoxin system RelE/ParE family toxin [Idiomarina abyssalis]MBJ7316700.1 type II toxin-antitoxin system RelE/ParE family toxin [Idiomarina abyssalis]